MTGEPLGEKLGKPRKPRLTKAEKETLNVERSFKELIRAFFILGCIGVPAGIAMAAIGGVYEVVDPSGPFFAMFVLYMGMLILPAGATALSASIGMRQGKAWGRKAALWLLWPMCVVGSIGIVTSLAQLQIGSAFMFSMVASFGARYLHLLYSKPMKARFNQGTTPATAGK